MSSIKWHPYPGEKPTKPGEYVVNIEQGHYKIWTVALYKSGKFVNWKDETDIKGTITAWAEEVQEPEHEFH